MPRAPVALTASPTIDASKLASHGGDVSRSVDDIFQHGVLVDLQIGFWSAAVRNAAEDLGITRSKLAPMIKGLGTKRLVPPEMSNAWTTLAGRARYIVRRDAFPFPIADVSFVPLTVLPKVERGLLDLQTEFFKTSTRLFTDFDEIRDEWVKKQPEQHRARLRALYPLRDVVRARFYFTFSTFTVAVPKKVRVESAKRERMEAEARSRLDAQERYRAQLEARVAGFVSDAAKTLRAKTVEMCHAIVQKIKTGDVVTQRSLNSLRTFIDRFSELNFVGDDEIESRLKTIKRDVLGERDADDFEGDERGARVMRERLETALEDVRETAMRVSDTSSTGLARRRIVV